MEKVNWVLLRGLAREKGHWVGFDKKVENAFNGSVICIDLPGAGEAINETVPLNINEMTDFVRQKWIEHKRSKDEKWSLLAISLGGMIAMDWTARYPKDFDQLVTINSSTKKLSSPFQRISPLAIKSIISTLLTRDNYEKEKIILNVTTNHRDIDQKIIQECADIAKERKIKVLSFLRQLLAASRFDLPKEITIPYLVLASNKDKFTSSKCSIDISKYFKTKIELHPTAGHDLPIDDGQWIIDKIKDFRNNCFHIDKLS